MQINRLRLLGFKSFVDPADLHIEAGLTGVVGPNGCGKSNLLEALRWVMGETSHKSMRAAAMDDVIFSGTSSRPSRNMAEVTIFLDNTARLAPAEFNDADYIEISRRIEREAGSAYRINGRDARARDVRVLFEDAATGARSPALVRQGQIAEIIAAKPEQRRRILEDAAGIAGLHTRRHEAELRLRAAENNLARLGDVLGQLGSQMEGLKRQARAARRYKDLSGEIRKSEAMFFHLTWSEAQAQVDAAEATLAATLGALSEAARAEAGALRAETETSAALEPLRQEEAERAAALTRLKMEETSLAGEAERAAVRERELSSRAEQLERDLARERTHLAEAEDTRERLVGDAAALDAADDESADVEAQAEAKLAERERALAEADQAVGELTNRVAEMRARRRSLETGLAERRAYAEKLARQVAALDTQRRELAARAPDPAQLVSLKDQCALLVAEIAEIEEAAAGAEEMVRARAAAVEAARETCAKARLAAGQLKVEAETLTKLLMPARDQDYPPVVDQVSVDPGFEAALGAALGEDLDAPVASQAPVHWRLLDQGGKPNALPAGVVPLSEVVEAPEELRLRLSQIGVVERGDGARLQAKLAPGQCLVTRDGDLWRWDGFVAAADGTTAAAQRLAERNRLSDIQTREREAQALLETLARDETAASQALSSAQADEAGQRRAWRDKQAAHTSARDALAVMERAAHDAETRAATVDEAKARADDELFEAHARIEETELAIEGLDEGEDLEPELAQAQAIAGDVRAALTELRAEIAGLSRERRARAERRAAIAAEQQRCDARRKGAQGQIEVLESRLEETQAERLSMADLPAVIADRRERLRDEIDFAERQRQLAADRLVEADTALRAARETLREVQGRVATAREDKARVEAQLEAARERRSEETRRIRDVLGVTPQGCLPMAEMSEDAPLPALADVERTLARLKADRERLGGVNLQAEEELTRLDDEFNALDKERTDVEEAVAKLRGAISQLNREGKRRLNAAFEAVNAHFQELFTSLFGGGEARLELIEGEDPLSGGLELIARPPGKKPATLSLLSGGEQALTAMSLIFAVFLTNPSPICVLDEVDAPLDDSNVDRFCTLLEKMASDTATRFLVITHHPMTMSRMQRLFGVTMAEKGVSQLVSVDLQTAQSFREAS